MVSNTQQLLGKHNILSEKRNTLVYFSNDDNTSSEKIDDLDEGESSDSSIESSYCELSLKRSAVNIKKINIRGHLKQLIDLAYTKSDLKVIEELESRVKKLLQDFTQKTTQGEMNELPQSNAGHQKSKRKNQHQGLPPAKKPEHPYSGSVGQTADVMLQFYRAKLELPREEESSIILKSVIEEDNLHTT